MFFYEKFEMFEVGDYLITCMDWQEIAALSIVSIAFLMLGIKFIIKKKMGALRECCYGGGKSGTILFKIKKGEKPRIIIKP